MGLIKEAAIFHSPKEVHYIGHQLRLIFFIAPERPMILAIWLVLKTDNYIDKAPEVAHFIGYF